MTTKELLKKVRQIEINIRGVVNEVFAGEYHSVFKGRGMEFAEVRNYQHGDDVRNIDWNVSARMNAPFIKMFDEERELTVMVLYDCSNSKLFGSQGQSKSEISAEIAALFASSAIKNNDKVGLIIFSDKIEKYVPPRKGRQHVLRIIRELLFIEDEGTHPESSGTNIATALEYLNQIVKRRATVFLISDFLADEYQRDLQIANKRHDLVGVRIIDPLEEKLPAVGLIELQDLETGKMTVIDTGMASTRTTAEKNAQKHKENLESFFKSIGMDHMDIYTNQSYIKPLTKFFRMRASRRR